MTPSLTIYNGPQSGILFKAELPVTSWTNEFFVLDLYANMVYGGAYSTTSWQQGFYPGPGTLSLTANTRYALGVHVQDTSFDLYFEGVKQNPFPQTFYDGWNGNHVGIYHWDSQVVFHSLVITDINNNSIDTCRAVTYVQPLPSSNSIAMYRMWE